MALDILIPYWGNPHFMREAVESVLAQTSPEWRLIVIDDAYPDPAIGDWLSAMDDPRVTYSRKAVNEGINRNFASCLRAAASPLMTMIGADDRLLPTYVADLLDAHRRFPDATIIQPGVQVIDERGQPITGLIETVKQRLIPPRGKRPQILRGELLATSLLRGNWLYWPSLAIRTDRIQHHDFSDEFPIMLDLDIILRMIFDGESLLVLDEVEFEYRRHSASLSSAAVGDGSRFTEERRFYGWAAERADALGWHRAARAARMRITSRAHAALTLPRAAARRDGDALRALARHAIGQ